jgi:hypothetical protein
MPASLELLIPGDVPRMDALLGFLEKSTRVSSRSWEFLLKLCYQLLYILPDENITLNPFILTILAHSISST